MSRPVITITGASGFVGQILRPRLRAQGYEVDVFDRLRGPVVDGLRRTWVGKEGSAVPLARARSVRAAQARAERALVRTRVLRPTGDDILDLRSRLAERFRGRAAVVHLAALAHPHVEGASDDDYRRINYEGAVNVFEAARDAGVPRFVFASSAQVYGINAPVRIDQFPILETNPLPTRAEGQSAYGAAKADFERYLEQACPGGDTQAVALRLECPGVRSNAPVNLYASTSVENTAAAFTCAVEAELERPVEICNVLDACVDPSIVDVQEFLAQTWPDVANHMSGNESLLGIERARERLGYAPEPGGTYYPLSLIWG
ncbi:MAG: NAD-dependent epimerase/dehydratase family protein [Solirubrobacteraceae bacterium]